MSGRPRRRIAFDRAWSASRLPALAEVDAAPGPDERAGIRRDRRDWRLGPSESAALAALANARGSGGRPTPVPIAQGFEVIRAVYVDVAAAEERFEAWWPRTLALPHATFQLVDRSPGSIHGRMRGHGRSLQRVDLAFEPLGPDRCIVHLCPEVRSRRLARPTERWWRTAHGLVDAAVRVVRCDDAAPPPAAADPA